MSLPSPAASGGNIRISGATNANYNTYAEILTATVDGKTATANFNVIIKDPCSSATFLTSPAPLTNMTVTMPSSATSTQNFVIKTDVEVANSTIVCPITATLTPTAAYISLSGNTISVNAGSIVKPTDYGTYTFTVTVVSSNFPGSVAQ